MGLLDFLNLGNRLIERLQGLFLGVREFHLDKGHVVEPQFDWIQHRAITNDRPLAL